MKLTSLLAVVLLVLSAGLTRAMAAELDKVTLQLNWLPEPEFGGFYAAEHDGIFRKHGLDVQINKGGPDVPSVPMTASGTVTFGLAAADEVVAARAKDADVVAIYTCFQTSPQGIMVKKERNVKDIAELLKSGGTLMAEPGLAYLEFFKHKFGGLKNITVVPVGSPSMARFLDPENKDAAMQCFITSEPLVAREHGVDPKVFLIAETGFNPYTGVVITRGDYLRDHHDVCKRFAAAVREGWHAYLADPKPANEVMARLNPSMDLKTFAAAAEAQKPLIADEATKKYGLGTMSGERWLTLTKQLNELHLVNKLVPYKDCFANP